MVGIGSVGMCVCVCVCVSTLRECNLPGNWHHLEGQGSTKTDSSATRGEPKRNLLLQQNTSLITYNLLRNATGRTQWRHYRQDNGFNSMLLYHNILKIRLQKLLAKLSNFKNRYVALPGRVVFLRICLVYLISFFTNL